MKRSTRALVGLVLIDALIVAGAAWLVGQIQSGHSHTTVPPGDAITQITTIAGAVIGVVTVLLGLAFVAQKRKGN